MRKKKLEKKYPNLKSNIDFKNKSLRKEEERRRQEDERLRQEDEQKRLGVEKSFQIKVEENENKYHKNIREKNKRRLKEEEEKKDIEQFKEIAANNFNYNQMMFNQK